MLIMYVIIGVIVLATVITVVLMVFNKKDVPIQKKQEAASLDSSTSRGNDNEVTAVGKEQAQTLNTVMPPTSDPSIKIPMGQMFSIKEPVSHGMKMVRKYFAIFLMAMLIMAVFNVPEWLLQRQVGKSMVIAIILSIIFFIVNVFIRIGFVKMTLMANRDQKPSVLELFSNGSLLIRFILVYVCGFFAVVGLVLLCIIFGTIFAKVPGMGKNIAVLIAVALGILVTIIISVLMIAWSMYQYFIVDVRMGPIQALKASFVLTRGCRWRLFIFYAVLFFFNIAGLLCLIVGLLFTIPASGVASAYVYDQLKLRRS